MSNEITDPYAEASGIGQVLCQLGNDITRAAQEKEPSDIETALHHAKHFISCLEEAVELM